jgi:hypothetical protein
MTWQEVYDSWEPVIADLRSQGFNFTQPHTVGFPVQLMGHLPDGRPFYFRERSGAARLGVGGPEPHWTPVEEASEDLWPENAPPAQRFLKAAEFNTVFDRLLSKIAPTGWAAVHLAFATTIARLESGGFHVDQKTWDPTWLEGTLPDGERFYLRQTLLEETCSLGVGGEDPENSPAWSITEDWVEPSPIQAPSWRPEHAEAMLRRAVEERR